MPRAMRAPEIFAKPLLEPAWDISNVQAMGRGMCRSRWDSPGGPYVALQQHSRHSRPCLMCALRSSHKAAVGACIEEPQCAGNGARVSAAAGGIRTVRPHVALQQHSRHKSIPALCVLLISPRKAAVGACIGQLQCASNRARAGAAAGGIRTVRPHVALQQQRGSSSVALLSLIRLHSLDVTTFRPRQSTVHNHAGWSNPAGSIDSESRETDSHGCMVHAHTAYSRKRIISTFPATFG